MFQLHRFVSHCLSLPVSFSFLFIPLYIRVAASQESPSNVYKTTTSQHNIPVCVIPGCCFTSVSWTVQNNLMRIYNAINHFLMRIPSWNLVRVPKAMLWAHIRTFSKEVRFLYCTHFGRVFRGTRETLVKHPLDGGVRFWENILFVGETAPADRFEFRPTLR